MQRLNSPLLINAELKYVLAFTTYIVIYASQK